MLADSETDTLFTMVVVAIMLGSTTAAYTNVAVELGVRLPMVHIPVELEYEVPAVAVAFWKINPAGKTSWAVAPVDVAGPLSLTTTV